MTNFRIARVLFASTAIVLLSQAVARANEERLGEVDLPISCSPAAQQQFNRAVAMLHSFFFPETVKAFTAIAEKEPVCAMAYWGIAISQRPNPLVGPFPGDVLKRGWEAIEKARAAAQKTERETAWIEALAAYYQDYATVPQQTRTADYEAAMARLSARYPDDAEAAIFYALALNEAADPADKTYARQLKAADILEKLEPKYPNHPGIPHYIIHSYDYPELAMRGVLAAARCAQLAPSAPHALHMPSHVFSTLGMWQEVIGFGSRGRRRDHRLYGSRQSAGRRRSREKRRALSFPRFSDERLPAIGAGPAGETYRRCAQQR